MNRFERLKEQININLNEFQNILQDVNKWYDLHVFWICLHFYVWYIFTPTQFRILDLIKLVLKLALDQYLEISNILNNPRELDEETIEQFKHDFDVIKGWIW